MKNLFSFIFILFVSINLNAQVSKQVAFGAVTLTESSSKDYYNGGPYGSLESAQSVYENLKAYLVSKGYSYIGNDSKVTDNDDKYFRSKLTDQIFVFNNVEKKKKIEITIRHRYMFSKGDGTALIPAKVAADDFIIWLNIKEMGEIKEADI